MRRILTTLALTAGLLAAAAAPAWAGSPHFVGDPTISRTGDALTVTFKAAGLGNETQINATLTADVQCVNPGNNEPQAENKGDVVASKDFPVQNGKSLGSLTGTGTTDPDCSPPMRLSYRNVVLTVSGDSFDPDLVFTFPGTF
jgi:hypothetical protein